MRVYKAYKERSKIGNSKYYFRLLHADVPPETRIIAIVVSGLLAISTCFSLKRVCERQFLTVIYLTYLKK